MILVDHMDGSKEIAPLLKSPNQITNLHDQGDFMFQGRGENEEQWVIGIERKKLADMLSSMRSKHTSQQLVTMQQTCKFIYLIFEGYYVVDIAGYICFAKKDLEGRWIRVRHGPNMYTETELLHFITTIEAKGHVLVRRTNDAAETARTVDNLFSWWNDPSGWDGHVSHLVVKFEPHPLKKASLLQIFAKSVGGVGLKRSKQVEQHFHSIPAAVYAPAEEWAKIPGITLQRAKEIVAEIWRWNR